jgi:hypothetical protein
MQEKYSSYAFFIAKSVLRKFNINLDYSQFLKEFKNKNSVYTILCQAPTTNIFNMLIIAQVKSYTQFVQKRFIDFYISNTSKDEHIEQQFPELIGELEQRFHQNQEVSRAIEQTMYDCIADTNKCLSQFVKEQIIKYGHLMSEIEVPIQKQIENLVDEANGIKQELIACRQTWRYFAIEVSDILMSVSDYHINELNDLEQRAELLFLDNLA